MSEDCATTHGFDADLASMSAVHAARRAKPGLLDENSTLPRSNPHQERASGSMRRAQRASAVEGRHHIWRDSEIVTECPRSPSYSETSLFRNLYRLLPEYVNKADVSAELSDSELR
jgi:hypothetical protein